MPPLLHQLHHTGHHQALLAFKQQRADHHGRVRPSAAVQTEAEAIFDLFGQHAFGSINEQTYSSQLHDIGLPPNVAASWEEFGKKCQAAAAAAKDHCVPAVILKTKPSVSADIAPVWK
ncbi:hypothetical protein OC835_007232 [Tilletia horrida]|nr:hypothetical protein OC835_007232 [Tilletia horrida]